MHDLVEGQRRSSNLLSQNQSLSTENGTVEAKEEDESISVQKTQRAGFIHQPE